MSRVENKWLVIGSFVMMFLSADLVAGQDFKINNSASHLKVEGTSNIHDWEMTAESFGGILDAKIENGQLVAIEELNFAVVAESLKSGKGGMDKKTYKALKTDNNQRITYQLEEVRNIDCVSQEICKLSTTGILNIAGTKKRIDLNFEARVDAEKIILSGEREINMTDYGIEPPSAMFGTITTGENVKIVFETVFNK